MPFAAQELIDDLVSTRLLYPSSLDMRRLLVDAMAAKLALAVSDRSPAAVQRNKAAAAAVTAHWPVLDAAGYQATEAALHQKPGGK
jgi:hypothetical protein